MRVLVTGGSGLLGWWVVRVLRGRGYEVYAAYRRAVPPGVEGVEWVWMDLAEPDGVVSVIRRVKPDIVVHSAAFTDVDGCELDKGLAYRVNYLGTLALAKASRSVGTSFFVYVSTDYVFDGEKGLYRENDVPAPVNYYGLTKLLGEVAVENIMENKASIIRVSGLYGCSPLGKRNFGLNALTALSRGQSVKAFYDQYLSPTYVPRLAEAIARLVEDGMRGVIHIAGERLSRYEFAQLLAEALGAEPGLVEPVPLSSVSLTARRPRDSSLDTAKARDLGLGLPPIRECVKEFIRLCKGQAQQSL